jgi:hypothetical protein
MSLIFEDCIDVPKIFQRPNPTRIKQKQSHTMKVSVPASAAIILPDTGASNLTGISKSPTQCIIIQYRDIKTSK